MRGWLHGFITLALVIYLVISLGSPTTFVLGTRLQQFGFIIAKLCSYGASAYYHLVDFQSIMWLRWANIIDVAMVPMAAVAIMSCMSEGSFIGYGSMRDRWLCELGVAALAMALNCFGVWLQFRTPVPGSADFRSVVTVIYYLYCEAVAYRVAVGFDRGFFAAVIAPASVSIAARIWYATIPAYCTAFGFGKVVDDFRMEECVCLPHHKFKSLVGKWTLHEDFHVLVLVADAVAVSMLVAHHRG